MAGILERNFMKVWLGAAGVIGYHIAADARAFSIERQDTKPEQLTIIYRRPFCPIGRVVRYEDTTKLGQSARDWQQDQHDNYTMTGNWQWVIPSPTGTHQIVYAHPQHGPLLGYYSRVWEVVIFPFRKLNV